MRKFLFLTILLISFLLVSCFLNEPTVQNVPEGIIAKQNGESVEVFSKTAASGIEITAVYETGSEVIFEEGLLGITNFNNKMKKIAVVGSEKTITQGDKIFTISKAKLSDIDFIGSITEEPKTVSENNRYVTGISLSNLSIEKNQKGYLSIHAKSVTGVKSFEFFVEYDPAYIIPDKLSAEDTSFVSFLGSFAGAMNIIKEENGSGTKKIIRIAGVLSSSANITDEDVIKINMVSPGLAGNSTVDFTDDSVIRNISSNTISTVFTPGVVSILDQSGVLLGDFDSDDEVGLSDFVLFAARYGYELGDANYLSLYDIAPAEDRYGGDWEGIYDYANPDGKVDLLDFIVFGNNYGFEKPTEETDPPANPTTPSPSNGQTGISLTPALSWTQPSSSRVASVLYDVYFGTSSNPTVKVASNISTTSYQASGLSYSTTYYWKVVAKNGDGESSGGPWNFQTLAAPVSEKTYRALTLGLTTYDAPGNNLDYTDDDSNDLQIVLSNLEEDYSLEKHTGRVTESQAKGYLDAYISQAGSFTSSDVFLFHYSGHGGYDSNGSYMWMSDSGNFYVSELRAKLDQLPGTKIVLIDSCESGDFINLVAEGKISAFEARKRSNEFNRDVIKIFSNSPENSGNYDTPYEYYVMTGCAINEYSGEDSFLRNGYFSFFFFDGLGDVGRSNPSSSFDSTYDADTNSNNSITFSESFNYTRQKVLEYSDDQTVQGYPQSSDFVIGQYDQGSVPQNPPSTPSNPSPSNGSTAEGSVSLSWSSSGATSYDIYFGTSSNPPLVKSNHTTTSYSLSTLTAGTKYYWKIAAKNSYGTTVSSVWNFTYSSVSQSGDRITLKSSSPVISGDLEFDYYDARYDSTNPTPPHWKVLWEDWGYVAVTFSGSRQFNLHTCGISDPSWGESILDIYINGDFFTSAEINSFWTNYYITEDAFESGENEIILVNAGWVDYWIDEMWVDEGEAPSNTPPSAPSIISPSSGSSGVSQTPTLSWSSVGATSYDVYFGGSSNPPKVLSSTANSTYSPGTLTQGSTYYWKIVAKNAYGSTTGSLWSFSVTSGGETVSGIDFEGPVYEGDFIVASNEAISGSSSGYSGSLSISGTDEKPSIPRGLELEAYKVNPVLPRSDEWKREDILNSIAEKRDVQQKAVGQTKQFYTYNFRTNQDEQITATLQAIGTRCEVWAKSTSEITTAKAAQIAGEFDSVIYSAITTNFYTPSDVNSDSKVAILCFDIEDDFDTEGWYVGGYFYSYDLYPYSGSNNMEIFYIDTYPSMHYPFSDPIDVSEQFSTLAHEFQHMVNFNRNYIVEGGADMDTWLDEGLSMAAEHLIYGKQTSRINYYNSSSSIKNGHSVLYWDESGDTLSNYSLSYLFLQYIRLQMGQGNSIFKEILEDSFNNYRAVENAIHAYKSASLNFGRFLSNFRIALKLKRSSGDYGFLGSSDFSGISTQLYTGSGTNIRGGGAVVKSISGSFTDPGNSGGDIQFVGIE